MLGGSRTRRTSTKLGINHLSAARARAACANSDDNDPCLPAAGRRGCWSAAVPASVSRSPFTSTPPPCALVGFTTIPVPERHIHNVAFSHLLRSPSQGTSGRPLRGTRHTNDLHQAFLAARGQDISQRHALAALISFIWYCSLYSIHIAPNSHRSAGDENFPTLLSPVLAWVCPCNPAHYIVLLNAVHCEYPHIMFAFPAGPGTPIKTPLLPLFAKGCVCCCCPPVSMARSRFIGHIPDSMPLVVVP